ncbi:MAG: serine hydrolase domain-containing protein [Pseudomonadota bacterium]
MNLRGGDRRVDPFLQRLSALRSIRLWFSLWVALPVLHGCTHSHTIADRTLREVEIVVGQGQRTTLTANERAGLQAWLNENRTGWDRYRVTLPAPEVMIRSEQFVLSLNVTSLFLTQSEPPSLVRELDKSDFEFFRSLGSDPKTLLACETSKTTSSLMTSACADMRIAQLHKGTAVTPPLSGIQISLMDAGRPAESIALGFAQLENDDSISLRTDHKVRIASVSKLVVAIGVMRLVESGQLDLDADVSDYLGWPLRNPAFPDSPITARQLLAHTSSVRDGSRYFIKAGQGGLRDFFDPESVLWEGGSHFASEVGRGPGQFFLYSNLGFGLLGTVIERVSGMRFDRFMAREVLEPLRLTASFSACDVAATQRAAAFRKRPVNTNEWEPEGPWVAQVDGGEPQCFYGMSDLDDPSAFLENYELGTNASLFSPQGGLRASADDLVRVLAMFAAGGELDGVRVLQEATVAEMLEPQWTFDSNNGQSAGEAEPNGPTEGLMTSYGLSVHRIDMRAWGFNDGPEFLVGHLGEAYGVLSLALFDPESGDGIASIITGTADDPAKAPGHSPLYRIEEEVLRWWVSRR